MTNHNRILQGDCTQLLKTIPDKTVDFVLTDPPYGVNYRDRAGRSIANDVDPTNILTAFDDIHRALKPDSFCVSFYGWNRIDAFFSAWTKAGFTPVGHIVWNKSYASNTGFLRYRHEQAYVLAKGRPAKPAQPIDDVQPWEYSGNRAHPTEKAVSVLSPLVQTFSRPGNLVMDPFAGSGSTLVAAALLKRSYLGIELEPQYCKVAENRLAGVTRHQLQSTPLP
jgi:adenine-specific DNA-methyltransferase